MLPLRSDAAECLPHKEIVSILSHAGYMWMVTAVTDQGFVMQIYRGKHGDAIMIMIDDDMSACVVAHFTQYMLPMEGAI